MAARKKATTRKTAMKKTSSSRATSRAKTTKQPVAQMNKEAWWKKYSFTKEEIIRRSLLFIVLVYVVINYRGLLIAATVNGQPISRLTVINQLEEYSGKETLDNIINETLIRQKAQQSHVEVTEEDINAAISDIEQNVLGDGQSIDDVLAMQGMTRDDLRKQLEVQVMVEKLLASDAVVTDEEVNQYVEANQDAITEEYTEEDLRNFAKEQLQQQKLSQRFSTWIQELKAEANINYLVEY